MKNTRKIVSLAVQSITAVLFSILLFSIFSYAYGKECGMFIAYLSLFVTFFVKLPKGILSADGLQINDISWSGYAAEYMITRAVVDVDTITKGAAYVVDGIRKKYTIPRVEVSGLIQHRQPTPSSQGNITVDGRVLDPLDFMLYQEFNPRDFEQHFYAEKLNDKLLDRVLPVTAENFIMLQFMKRLNEYFEIAYWNSRLQFDPAGAGVNPTSKGYPAANTLVANADYMFDGFIKKMLDDPAVQLTTGTTLTASNIVTYFLSSYQALIANPISKALAFRYGKDGLRLFISYADQIKYEEYMATITTFKNQDTSEKGINRYKGYDVVPLAGLPENTFFWAIGRPDTQSNLWIGVNSVDDVQLEMMHLQNNSEMWFVKGLFKVDVNHGFGDQIMLCTTLTD
jgi:hypothetical protein